MEATLRKLQLTQLEILRVFDRFCREHDLKYSLYAGSLLGAVHHKGFIPWDDDLESRFFRGCAELSGGPFRRNICKLGRKFFANRDVVLF